MCVVRLESCPRPLSVSAPSYLWWGMCVWGYQCPASTLPVYCTVSEHILQAATMNYRQVISWPAVVPPTPLLSVLALLLIIVPYTSSSSLCSPLHSLNVCPLILVTTLFLCLSPLHPFVPFPVLPSCLFPFNPFSYPLSISSLTPSSCYLSIPFLTLSSLRVPSASLPFVSFPVIPSCSLSIPSLTPPPPPGPP